MRCADEGYRACTVITETVLGRYRKEGVDVSRSLGVCVVPRAFVDDAH